MIESLDQSMKVSYLCYCKPSTGLVLCHNYVGQLKRWISSPTSQSNIINKTHTLKGSQWQLHIFSSSMLLYCCTNKENEKTPPRFTRRCISGPTFLSGLYFWKISCALSSPPSVKSMMILLQCLVVFICEERHDKSSVSLGWYTSEESPLRIPQPQRYTTKHFVFVWMSGKRLKL